MTLARLSSSVNAEPLETSSKWVKLRRTQYEHMFSALPSNSDIARRSRHPLICASGTLRLDYFPAHLHTLYLTENAVR